MINNIKTQHYNHFCLILLDWLGALVNATGRAVGGKPVRDSVAAQLTLTSWSVCLWGVGFYTPSDAHGRTSLRMLDLIPYQRLSGVWSGVVPYPHVEVSLSKALNPKHAIRFWMSEWEPLALWHQKQNSAVHLLHLAEKRKEAAGDSMWTGEDTWQSTSSLGQQKGLVMTSADTRGGNITWENVKLKNNNNLTTHRSNSDISSSGHKTYHKLLKEWH